MKLYLQIEKLALNFIFADDAPEKMMETNLIEDDMGEVAFSGNKITVPVGHFEIKTLKVSF